MREAETIRRLLTARQVAEFYGFHANRAGNISCPFHRGDRTPSLKLYDGEGGFHCFGCGAHGFVIDFVMKLFDLNFRQAVMRLDTDFNLGLSRQKQQFSNYSAAIEKRRAEIRARVSIMGQRIAMRIIIWKVICRLATSEVRRVTMDAEENLSMLLKLNCWTL